MEALSVSESSPFWKRVRVLSFLPVSWFALTVLQGIAFFLIWLCFVRHTSWISYALGFGVLGLWQKTTVWGPSMLFAILCPYRSTAVRWVCCVLAVSYLVIGGFGYLSMDEDMTGMGKWVAIGYILWVAFNFVMITIKMREVDGGR